MNNNLAPRKKPGIFSQIPKILSMAYYSFRAQLRNPATFAFGFIFPAVFISIFGLIGNGGGTSVKIGVPDGSADQTPIYKAFERIPAVKLSRGNIDYLRSELGKGKIDGVVLITQTVNSKQPQLPSYSVSLETSNANVQTSAVVLTLVGGIVDKINLSLVAGNNIPVSLVTKEISGRVYRFIDYILPGQIGFAILSTAIFSTAFGLIFLKKTLVLKRIFATPTRPISIILGQGLARWVNAVLQTILILAFGVFIFHFNLANGWVTFTEMLLLSSLGLVVFLGFGLFISGIASDENSVAPIANLFTLPQFLLSGSFFPTDLFPQWVQPIANHLPLYYLNDAMRKVATEGAGLSGIYTNVIALLIWGVIAYFVASRTFKWQ